MQILESYLITSSRGLNEATDLKYFVHLTKESINVSNLNLNIAYWVGVILLHLTEEKCEG